MAKGAGKKVYRHIGNKLKCELAMCERERERERERGERERARGRGRKRRDIRIYLLTRALLRLERTMNLLCH